MRRRTKWTLALAVGIASLLLAGLALTLFLSSPNPRQALSSIEVKDLPGTWTQSPGLPPEGSQPPGPSAEEVPAGPPRLESFGLPVSGTLAMLGSRGPFGEETFELALEGDSVALHSQGRFWFKALVATLTVRFDQELHLDPRLRPTELSLLFNAPLGFDREVQASFRDGQAAVRSGSDMKDFAVELDRAFVLGTFATYAIIPLLYELREFEGETELDALVFGGPPNRDDGAGDAGLPRITVERIEDALLRFADQTLPVAQYRLAGDMGTISLYARGIELLGLIAGEGEESLFVYRADYFPDGFEVGGEE